MSVNVRKSTDGDRPAIIDVIMITFGETEGRVVADLVVALLDDPTAQPLVSLVATVEKRVVGYALFTNVRIEGAMEPVRASILAPLAVHPSYQNKGIGGELVNDGLARLKEAGVDLVFVLGHPGYYPKYGFRPAGKEGFDAPYPIAPENAQAWMVRELRAGVLGRAGGKVLCADALDEPQLWR